MQKRNWWTITESIAILSTIIGSVGAEIFRQSLFLSAPLSATLLLSFLNRRQANEAIQQQTDREISQLRRDFYQLDQYVLESIKNLNQQVGIQTTPPESFYPVKVTLEPPIELTLRETHRSQPRTYQSLPSAPDQDQADLAVLDERSLTPLLMVQAQLLQLSQRVEQLNDSTVSEDLETQVVVLADMVKSLEQKTNALPPAKEVTTMLAAIKTLYQRQTNLEKNIAQVIQQEIRAGLASLSDGETSDVKTTVAQLSAEVVSLKQQYNLGSASNQATNAPSANRNSIAGQSTEVTASPDDQRELLEKSEQKWSSNLAKQRFEDLATAIVQLEQDLDNPALKKHLTLLASALYTASVKSQS